MNARNDEKKIQYQSVGKIPFAQKNWIFEILNYTNWASTNHRSLQKPTTRGLLYKFFWFLFFALSISVFEQTVTAVFATFLSFSLRFFVMQFYVFHAFRRLFKNFISTSGFFIFFSCFKRKKRLFKVLMVLSLHLLLIKYYPLENQTKRQIRSGTTTNSLECIYERYFSVGNLKLNIYKFWNPEICKLNYKSAH